MLKQGFEIIDGRDLPASLSSIPTSPGIYAWYHRLSLDHADPNTFRTTLNLHLNGKRQVPVFNGKLGPYAAKLNPQRSDLSTSKKTITNAVARSKKARPKFSYALLVTSIFQPPLYVGKADGRNGLRQRIKDHVNGKTDFAQKMLAKSLMPRELVVAFIPMVKLPARAPELLEYLLTVVATPPFVDRRG
jgi:hypothetical protein